jgi:hypothetical protein
MVEQVQVRQAHLEQLVRLTLVAELSEAFEEAFFCHKFGTHV